MRYENIAEFNTKLTADVVEWRPASNDLACATYFLDKEKNERHGSIHLLRADVEHKKLDHLHTLEFEKSGILDLKWLDSRHLITIDSNNSLDLVECDGKTSLKLVNTKQLNPDQESVGLTLDLTKQASTYKVISSDSTGCIYLTSVDDQTVTVNEERRCHDLEIWSLMIDKTDPNIVYSGADDCTFKIWDMRQPDAAVSTCQIFEGGVTSILSPSRGEGTQQTYLHNYGANNLLVGSYDERIRVLDKRALKRCVRESSKLDGGVWKQKLHASRDVVLCACMHTGVHIVELDHLHSVLYYDKHGLNSLAYGCDWSKSDDHDVIATCSFYNHSLRVWKVFS